MCPLCNVSVLQRSCYFQPLPGRSSRKRSAGKSQAPTLHWEPVAACGSGRKAARILPKSADGVQSHRCQRARGKPAKSFPFIVTHHWKESTGTWIRVGSVGQANCYSRQIWICKMFLKVCFIYVVNSHFTWLKEAEIVRAAVAKDGKGRAENNELFARYLTFFPRFVYCCCYLCKKHFPLCHLVTWQFFGDL